LIAAHKAERHKGKYRCKKCGRKHHVSEHWSHTHGSHRGAHGETSWFGRAERPQKVGGRRKKTAAAHRRGRHVVKKGYTRHGTTFGPVIRTPTKRHKATWGAMSAAEVRRAGRKARRAHEHLVRGHLAKNPHHKGKHRVAAHLAHDPVHHKKAHKAKAHKAHKGGHKKHRSAAQRAATAHLVALNKARGRKKGGHKAKGGHKKAKHRAHGAGLPRTPWSA
jgi:hypothetical protein